MKEERSVNENFSSMILYLRKKKNMSLREVSDVTGIDPAYIHKLEKGKRTSPSYPIIEKLALAYGVDTVDLLEVSSNNSGRSTVSLGQLLLSNNFTVDGVDDFSPSAKKALLDLIDLIVSFTWDKESMFEDIYEAMHAIDDLKQELYG
ncbi:helix-turn-helix domain-containing protein [Bacillus tuaregi]|uniref:helix-turn-helix domain-containing protein n=1 Tax=Bacillus tuaregi TaxID=1816695 RepID=UPI0008F8906B|nr:helix-turn-helix transcriptional regulator [Bacillus tuaregi]